jgi:agmatine deiminase
MKLFFLLLFSLVFASISYSQNGNGLPSYMTDYEKSIYDDYIKNPPRINGDDPNPPPGPVRTMAEWEECQGIIITWTSFTPILSQIVSFAQIEGKVFIICSDSNSVKTYLTGAGVPLINLKFLITGFNSIWCRDYGPWAVYSNNSDTLRVIDWIYNRPRPLDDATPVFFANYIGVPIHQTIQAPNNLIATGGNFMVDGNGTGFSSRLILIENPTLTESHIDSIMAAYMGLKRYIKMDVLPNDVIHHIDMHIKLLDEETLLVGQYPTGIADGPQIEINLQYILANFQTCYGRPYKVVRILMPPDASGNYPNTGGDYRTYTNSLIINKTVIIPKYELRYDTTAFRIYRESMPGYNIVGIDCNAIIPSLGAVHCITKEIGVSEPIFISHAALQNSSNTTQAYEVKAYIHTKSGVANAKVFWSTDTANGFNQLNMTAAADTFRAFIPAEPLNTKIYYYIWANSNSGRTVTKPLPAPRGNYQFNVTNIIGISGNGNNIPGTFKLYQNYPNPFNPKTVITYRLRANSNVRLVVYDITGKIIMELVNQKQNAGNYKIDFDGTNIASGIYFYKIEVLQAGSGAGSFADIKKMILIK